MRVLFSRTWLFLALLSTLALLVLAQEDLYKVLGVKKSATDQEIKKAYRKLSIKYHPDKNPDNPSAHSSFISVSSAYETLSDSESRSVYDRYGHEGLKQHEAQKSQGGGGGAHGNPFDMFSNFFGRQQQQQANRGPGMLTQMEVELKDMYTGKNVEFSIPRKILCDHCRGSGAASDGDIKACQTCGGRGIVIRQAQVFPGMVTNMQTTCNSCGGKGKTISRACPNCHQSKTIDILNHLDIEIPAGAPENWETVFDGEADESPDWEAGDVIVRVRSRSLESDGWRRKENGLYRREELSLDEALLGFQRHIKHLDDHMVTIKREGTTQPGHVEVIKGEGMPAYRNIEQGDLFVEFTVILPTSISPSARQGLESVFAPHRSPSHNEL